MEKPDFEKRNPVMVVLGLLGAVLIFALWSVAVLIRRLFCLPIKWDDACIRAAYRTISKCVGLKVQVIHGDLYDPTEAAVIISNHSSLLDIPAVYLATSARVRMLSKRELYWIPLLGWGMWAARHVSVNRGSRSSSALATSELTDRLRRGYQIYLAPEGTRSSKGCLLPFKTGAFRIAVENKVPIFVLALEEPWTLLPKGSVFPSKKGVVRATFLARLSPLTAEGLVKSHEELLSEARQHYLRHGFVEC